MTDVRVATADDESTVRSICNAAMLEVPEAAVREGTTQVAVDDDRILGALVLDGQEIEAVAVRPGRRGQGIGTALVEAAAERRDELTAGFDPGVRPFYEKLGFEVECEDGRCRGVV
ncbi:GNAT family N-acetyltransferase [Natronomonas amylolytica]|uniref:GNAT family N-acetyltransferase n=1 Tax=Natronomonas amylolytica TaxID=3108498 RepID=UPI003008F4B2